MRRTVWTLLVFLVGCAPKQAEQEPPVSRTDIMATSRETRYPMDHLGAGSIQLADGAYRDSAAGLSVKLERSAVGDVDGDGRADAAVILASQTGGSGTFFDLYTVLDREAGAVARGPASLGDRVKVDSIHVADHVIRLSVVRHGPNDPLCCPTQRAVETFVLHADTLMRRPAEQP